MQALEIARRLGAMGQRKDAIEAYMLSLNDSTDPAARLEAAAYILQNGGDYRVTYTVWQDLYNRGYYREEILPLMDKVFYEPNIRLLKNRYERNCARLREYPYLFRDDFIPFEKLPIRFYPYDDHNGYVPFYVDDAKFGGFVNVRDQRVTHNFFKDLENPILAEDVFSQYELEYLNDNVRKSEWVARENHIYLHYTDWSVFCSWLCVLNMRPLLGDKKFVFLIGDEIDQYPIDFKERFGIDYSQYTLKPVGIREVNRMIWHTQLSTHNGGDFFNEVFDWHPNLLAMSSMMMYNVEEVIKKIRDSLESASSLQEAMQIFSSWKNPRLVRDLYCIRNPTDKDLLVTMFLAERNWTGGVDWSSRIAPAIFFQPHFHNIVYKLKVNERNQSMLWAENVDILHKSPIFKGFKYIKTFTPMRRFTTSHGATVKFMYYSALESAKKFEAGENGEDEKHGVVSDAVTERVLNRSFMIDPEDRLYHDSVLVRFEDGKLNGKATFTALAAFLDLPYTESMTYCSERGDRGFFTPGNAVGFDPESVYRTYDEYANDSERYYIEYFLRDAYEFYGYDFKYYDGQPVDEEKADALIDDFTTIDHWMRETWKYVVKDISIGKNATITASDGSVVDDEKVEDVLNDALRQKLLDSQAENRRTQRKKNTKVLLRGLRFVNKHCQPLYMMPKLQLDPALLEQPLYH